jgi:hypothetical protein
LIKKYFQIFQKFTLNWWWTKRHIWLVSFATTRERSLNWNMFSNLIFSHESFHIFGNFVEFSREILNGFFLNWFYGYLLMDRIYFNLIFLNFCMNLEPLKKSLRQIRFCFRRDWINFSIAQLFIFPKFLLQKLRNLMYFPSQILVLLKVLDFGRKFSILVCSSTDSGNLCVISEWRQQISFTQISSNLAQILNYLIKFCHFSGQI